MPFIFQPVSFSNGNDFDVITTMYCMSLHVKLGFASRASATKPAAKGADADVPEQKNRHMDARHRWKSIPDQILNIF